MSIVNHMEPERRRRMRSGVAARAVPSRAQRRYTLDDAVIPITRYGDAWQLGRHVLICDDALRPEAVSPLMGDDRAQLAITKLPIAVPCHPNAVPHGREGELLFGTLEGALNRSELLPRVRLDCARHLMFCCPLGRLVVRVPWCLASLVRAAAQERWQVETQVVGAEMVFALRDTCDQGHPPPPWRALLTAGNGIAACLGQVLRRWTQEGDLVLDLFADEGDTLMAAEATRRVFRGMEGSPAKVDAILQRWQEETGEKVRLPETARPSMKWSITALPTGAIASGPRSRLI